MQGRCELPPSDALRPAQSALSAPPRPVAAAPLQPCADWLAPLAAPAARCAASARQPACAGAGPSPPAAIPSAGKAIQQSVSTHSPFGGTSNHGSMLRCLTAAQAHELGLLEEPRQIVPGSGPSAPVGQSLTFSHCCKLSSTSFSSSFLCSFSASLQGACTHTRACVSYGMASRHGKQAGLPAMGQLPARQRHAAASPQCSARISLVWQHFLPTFPSIQTQ